jgi:hypothetical protein
MISAHVEKFIISHIFLQCFSSSVHVFVYSDGKRTSVCVNCRKKWREFLKAINLFAYVDVVVVVMGLQKLCCSCNDCWLNSTHYFLAYSKWKLKQGY